MTTELTINQNDKILIEKYKLSIIKLMAERFNDK